MPTSVELRQERAQLWERMKEIRDLASDRELTAEEEANFGKANNDLTSLDKRIVMLETEERAPAAPDTRMAPGREVATGKRALTVLAPEYRDAFDAWLRHDPTGQRNFPLAAEHREVLSRGTTELATAGNAERRALSVLNATAGGYLVAPEFSRTLEEALLFYGGMREAATVITTDTGADLPYPTVDDTTNTGAIVAENAAFSTQDVAFSAVVLKAFKYSSNIVKVPWELMQDSAFDLSSFLARALGTRIGRIQNTHFTVGSGSNSPKGLMLSTTQGRAGATGTATSTTGDELLRLVHSVDPAYRNARGVRWMFHDNSLLLIRLLKDGEGRYLFQPGLVQGQPNSILGYPYVVNNDVAQMAASKDTIAFGDLSAYIIRQVRDVQLIRLDELYAANGQVGFVAWSRADGGLLDAGTHPVKHFTNSAT